jgi:hypothetical protein
MNPQELDSLSIPSLRSLFVTTPPPLRASVSPCEKSSPFRIPENPFPEIPNFGKHLTDFGPAPVDLAARILAGFAAAPGLAQVAPQALAARALDWAEELLKQAIERAGGPKSCG